MVRSVDRLLSVGTQTRSATVFGTADSRQLGNRQVKAQQVAEKQHTKAP